VVEVVLRFVVVQLVEAIEAQVEKVEVDHNQADLAVAVEAQWVLVVEL
jgi:hypothetical protein